MNSLQRILKVLYPVLMKIGRNNKEKGMTLKNDSNKKPVVSFYSLKFTDGKGKEVSFERYKGKKVILVNVASFCGYTSQYDALEKLYIQYGNKVEILGFPANNFGAQEPGSDEQIADFCRLDYGVTFPIFKKDSVLQPGQNPVYNWLTDPGQNGWNSQVPVWNFCKYVVNENGVLTHFFASAISPDSPEMLKALN